jgi:hypothetical protein
LPTVNQYRILALVGQRRQAVSLRQHLLDMRVAGFVGLELGEIAMRLDLQRPQFQDSLERGTRLVDETLRAQAAAEIVQRLDVVRPIRQRLAIFGDRAVVLLAILQQDAEIEMGDGELGLEFDRAHQVRLGLEDALQPAQAIAEIRMRLGQAGLGLQRGAVALLGVGEALQGLLGDAQRVAQRGVARHERQRDAQRRLGLGVAPQRDQQQPEIGLRGGEVGPQRDGLLEPRDRLVGGAPPRRRDALLEQVLRACARWFSGLCRRPAASSCPKFAIGRRLPAVGVSRGYRVSGSKLSAG